MPDDAVGVPVIGRRSSGVVDPCRMNLIAGRRPLIRSITTPVAEVAGAAALPLSGGAPASGTMLTSIKLPITNVTVSCLPRSKPVLATRPSPQTRFVIVFSGFITSSRGKL